MKTYYQQLLLLPFLSLTITFLNAQVIPDVTPDNIGDAVDVIFDLHGDIIEANYLDVYDFIDGLLPDSTTDPAYDPLCHYPDADIDLANTNSTTIAYTWPAIPGAHDYQISFMKLNALSPLLLEQGTIVTPTLNAQFTVSNGLILMAFQSKCSETTIGKIDIVIVEKPVFLTTHTVDCECVNPGNVQTETFGASSNSADNVVNFDYTHSGDVGFYRGSIAYNDDLISNFLIKVEFEGDDQINIYKGDGCIQNLIHEYDGSIFYSKYTNIEESEIHGAISFFGGITFDPAADFMSQDFEGTFTMKECLHPKKRSGMDDLFSNTPDYIILAKPNPSSNKITIESPVMTVDGQSQCFLMNALGKQIYLPSNALHRIDGTFELDIRELPVGTYNFVLVSDDKIWNSRFVKVN